MTTTQRQLRRDTTANIAGITPAQGEPVFDVSRNALALGDGIQAGGHYATPFVGAWTPALSGSTAPGSQSYAVQAGWFVKIGKLVIAQGRITLSANSGGAGNAQITGLPFGASAAGNSHGTLILSYVGGVTHAAGYTQLHGYIGPSTSNAFLAESGSNQSAANVPIANVGATADIIFAAIYEAAADND